MATYTVRNLLDRSRAFHHEISEFYRRLDSAAAQDRVRMILKYLQRHEENLASCIAAYEQGAGAAVLNTWFKSTPDLEIPPPSELTTTHPDLSVEEVVALAMRYDDCLIRLYRHAEENAVSQDVKDLFQKLRTMTESEEHQLARDAVEMQDL